MFKPSREPVGHLLAVSKVDGVELGILLWGRLAVLVLIQEDGATAHFHAELLDALLVVHRQQERLVTSLWLDGKHDGEIFWENSPWRKVETRINVHFFKSLGKGSFIHSPISIISKPLLTG